MNNKITSVCIPKGFYASALNCGIRRKGLDLSLIYSKVPAKASGVFTQNALKAAPVLIDQKHLKKETSFSAIVVNSANANCATGKQGIKDAEKTCSSLANILKIKPEQILVASTGIIGKKLPVNKIIKSLPKLVYNLNRLNANYAAKAMMTTDTHEKEISSSFKIGNSKVNLGAITKGAGMIEPNMATMLSFITTDVNISQRLLNKALKEAVSNSFNKITIDGCTSTNDSVIILANGLAKNKLINNANSKAYKEFYEHLEWVCLKSAKMIVKDAEGATKFITIIVKGAKNLVQANKIGFAIANSTLFKTAVFGENPNWGRIIAAIGKVPDGIKPEKISIYLGKTCVFKKGVGIAFSKNEFKKEQVEVTVNLNLGKFATKVFTSDLSSQYVKINAEYN